MSSKQHAFALSRVARATLLLLCASPLVALAADEETDALTQAASTLEVGVASTSQASAKFGEYNGLNQAQASLIGNFSLRGGSAYGMGAGLGRWELEGSNLGTTAGSVGLRVSEQGQWSIGLRYEELRHNLWDSYQTPYVGANGGNSFTLPGFGLAANTTTLTTDQLAAYHNLNVDSTRRNSAASASVDINARLALKLDFNHLEQSGAKLMAFGSAAYGSTPAPGGEVVSILPNPTRYQTNSVNASLQWSADGAHLNAAYYGSFFRNSDDRVMFTTYAGAANAQTMSTPPGNDFHQLSLGGSYPVGDSTRLSGTVSVARNTQNDPFVVDAFMYITPSVADGNLKASLNGVVVTQHADLKLTQRSSKDLQLTVAWKYDGRDNQTESSIYNFQAIGANNIANYPNTPLSTKKSQGEAVADYRIDSQQKLRVGFTHDEISRWCNQYAIGGTNYPAGTNCVVAVATKEDKLSASYKVAASEDVNANLGYSFGKRQTTSDPNAIVAMIGVRGGDVGAVVGTIKGLNGGDYQGFYPVFDASRTQQMLKTGLNLQAAENLNLDIGARYTDDKYDSTYGVQSGKSWALHLDSAYHYAEDGAFTAYASRQYQQRDLTDLQRSIAQGAGAASATAVAIPVGATWTNVLKTDEVSVGLNLRQGGLLGGKVVMVTDLSYSLGSSNYATALNYSTTTTGGITCADPRIFSCGALPDVRAELAALKLNASYRLDKSSQVALGYVYQKLLSSDYYYNGLAYGYNPNSMLATNQVAPNYEVQVVAVSYLFNF